MIGATSMFVLSENGLVALQPVAFSTEAEFQALLAEPRRLKQILEYVMYLAVVRTSQQQANSRRTGMKANG